MLFLTGLVAGTVDAIAGGGGLISIPVLLGAGIPPHLALGTNKFQSSIGTFAAAYKYYQHGYASLKTALPGILAGAIGAIAGSITAQMLSSDILYSLIPILLSIIFVYTLFSTKLGKIDIAPRMSEFLFYVLFGFGLSFYDGFFGPGVGSFWVFSISFFLGYNIIKATAYTKILNSNSNIVSMLCFALGSNIDYRIGICMAAGQLIGGRLGAHLAIRNGAKLIRPVFLSIVSLTLFSLLSKHYLHNQTLPIILIFILLAFGSLTFYYRRFVRVR